MTRAPPPKVGFVTKFFCINAYFHFCRTLLNVPIDMTESGAFSGS